MPFRFRKSFKVLPGMRINLSNRGVSTSVGTRGMRVTSGARGTTTSVGLPGTGMSYVERTGGSKNSGISDTIFYSIIGVVLMCICLTVAAIVFIPNVSGGGSVPTVVAPVQIEATQPPQRIEPIAPGSGHPSGTSGKCADGSYTKANNKQGACSSHGGVSEWWGQ